MSLRSESICPRPRSSWRGHTRSSIMDPRWARARFSFPVRVGTMLTAAVPALEERLLAERIRQGWRGAVGRRAGPSHPARRSAGRHPHGDGRQFPLAPGALHAIRGSPRSGPRPVRPDRHRAAPEPRRARAGPGAPGPAPRRARGARCGSTPTRWPSWTTAAAPVRDEALASTVRRIMAKGLIARRGGALMGVRARGGRARRLRHHADERGRARRPQDHHDRPARPPGGQRSRARPTTTT